ncbi:hypothetical protein CEXT_247721 [Caerostris extrusa]|uniref:Uncharacterized protein n=1 Tax=Caerostris extrusa TaxID=172846 RepID=A0AAV4MQ84_CAEEX|nr:hypothetical protein CEXT_247721 [Caerostris extrusa]
MESKGMRRKRRERLAITRRICHQASPRPNPLKRAPCRLAERPDYLILAIRLAAGTCSRLYCPKALLTNGITRDASFMSSRPAGKKKGGE